MDKILNLLIKIHKMKCVNLSLKSDFNKEIYMKFLVFLIKQSVVHCKLLVAISK